MSRHKVGDRIGAIRNADETHVYMLGFGVYEGEQLPPDGEFTTRSLAGVTSPRLRLDDGTVVWGYQCWWGPEDKIKERYKDHVKVDVKLDTP